MSTQIELFHHLSSEFSRRVTERYSTSFSLAIRLLSPCIRQDIYNIYGFVRLTDEIVDTFHNYPKEDILNRFEAEVYYSLKERISIHPVLNSFQQTVHTYAIDLQLIRDFLESMRTDLTKKTYSDEEYRKYIYGSADVVGLMCLKVFVKGDEAAYQQLRPMAERLGSAFQKVNFLRDMKDDLQYLSRTYFPGVKTQQMSKQDKDLIIDDVKQDFREARKGITLLPNTARLGVMTAYRYYYRLLRQLEKSTPEELKHKRVRVPDIKKLFILATSYLMYKFSVREEAW